MPTLVVVAVCATRVWTAPVLVQEVTHPSVVESSGLAASTRFPGVLYTHNDSGDSARVFRVLPDGTVTAITVTGASAVDWEDMASARVAGTNYLYIADVGDNLLVRPTVRVYRFVEPDLGVTTVSGVLSFTLTYPDGRHNCEALVVDPASGDLYLVTKDPVRASVYRVNAPTQTGSFALTKLGDVFPDTGGGNPGRLVTGGSASPTGKHVTIRTYTGALEYPAPSNFQDWWRQMPVAVVQPVTAQGESIAYGAGGRALLSTSEGNPCPVFRQRLLESLRP